MRLEILFSPVFHNRKGIGKANQQFSSEKNKYYISVKDFWDESAACPSHGWL